MSSETDNKQPRSAGRPRGFDPEQVLDGALELFWRNGCRATTTRELESRLGISQPSLYNAFGSKRGLLAAVMERYEERVASALVRPLEQSDQGLEAVDRFFSRLGEWISKESIRGCMFVSLMAEDGGASKDLTVYIQRYFHRVRSALRAALVRAAASGETGNDRVDERVELMVSLILGLNVAARGGATRTELQRSVRGARAQIAAWRT